MTRRRDYNPCSLPGCDAPARRGLSGFCSAEHRTRFWRACMDFRKGTRVWFAPGVKNRNRVKP